MSSGQDSANRILEDVRRILAPQTAGLADDLRDLQNYLSSSILPRIDEKLSSLREIEVPSISSILAETLETLEAAVRKKESEKALLAQFTREIRRRETQEEILEQLLDAAYLFAPRTALLVVRGEQIAGWASRGYPEETVPFLRSCSFQGSADDILQNALKADGLTSVTEIPLEHELRKLVENNFEAPMHLVALKAIRRPVALLLAQDTADRTCDLDSLCTIVEITGLCIENIALKILQEMRAEANRSRPRTPPGEPAYARTAPADESQPAPPKTDTSATEVGSGPVETPEEPMSAEVAASEVASIETDRGPEPGTATAEAEEIEVSSAPEDTATAEHETPPIESQGLSEEERLHAEAKRFARLLVSEIKLYNEQRVVEGRHNRDLYVRLKRDIDRSREMYEKRTSHAVSRKIDYFHDEVIRILGENDPSTLGSDYPGPRVES